MNSIGLDAKELGTAAYKRGLSIETNPFREDTDEAKAFKAGWKFAHKLISADARRSYKIAKRTNRNEINS